MRICHSKVSYVVAYSIFVMLYGSPSHHHLANAASTTEDDDLQTKVLLTGKIGAPFNTKAKLPLGDVLSEEKEEEANTYFAAVHDASSLKRKLDGSALGAICSDDTSWSYDGKSSKHCGWVYFSPERHCLKKSVDGVPASEACPIACGDQRTKPCDIPKCSDESWFFWWPKRGGKWKVCNDYLHQHVKSRCRKIGVTTLGNNQKFFAYQYCSKCSGPGNACVLPTSPTSNPTSSNSTSSPTTSPTSSPSSSPSSNPTSNPSFVTTDELKDAVDDYCGDPEAWITNTKYAKYGPIEEWDVSNIDDMYRVFFVQSNCNPNIADWDVSGVTNFDHMFYYASSFNQDIGGWDVSNGQGFNYMFVSASSFNQDIGGWDVSKGTSFFGMFFSASSFNQDIGGWDVSSGTNFGSMFYMASSFNQDIREWDVSNGQGFWFMFYRASSFNQDIGGWDVSSGTGFNWMFHSASSFNQDLCDWDIDDSAGTTYFCLYAFSCGACSF